MTNLIGTITFAIVTNWVTVSVEKPQCHYPGCREIHHELHYQMGTVTTNTVLNMEWRGQHKEIILESEPPSYVTRLGKVECRVPKGFYPVHTNELPYHVVEPQVGIIVKTNKDGSISTNPIPPLLITKPKK